MLYLHVFGELAFLDDVGGRIYIKHKINIYSIYTYIYIIIYTYINIYIFILFIL